MRKILKIGLLFATITATANVVMAGTVAVEKQTHSIEGLNGVTATQTSNSISYTLAAEYSQNDTITFDFTNTALSCDSLSDPINSTHANFSLAKGTCTNSSVTYTVSGGHSGDTTGAVVTLGAIGYKVDGLIANDLTVTVSSQDTNGAIDTTGTLVATIAEAKSQFVNGATISPKFDNLIDVAASRQTFLTVNTDTLTWTVSKPDTTDWLNLATIDNTIVTLTGSGQMSGNDVSQFTSSPAAQLSFDVNNAQLSATFTGDNSTVTLAFETADVSSSVVLEAQNFTLSSSYDYTSAGNVTDSYNIDSNLAAGSWRLNGASAIIPYMPYSDTDSQIIYVTNLGNQAGDIMVEAVDNNGVQYDLGVIGVAEGKKITKLTDSIAAELNAKYKTLNNTTDDFAGKIALLITVNAPASDIQVYASYNVDTVRGYVEVLYLR